MKNIQSRRHAVVNFENDKYYICDYINTLGVYVNGDKIDKEKYIQLKYKICYNS